MKNAIQELKSNDTATTENYTLTLHDALPILATPGRSLVIILTPPV